MTKYIFRALVFIVVLLGIWTITWVICRITGVSQGFWLETICISHIAYNVSQHVLK